MTTSEGQGLVLAGGTSRRFDDGDKALATIDGRPLLATVVATVRAALDSPPIVAVASREQSERYRSMLDGPVRFVTDAPDGRGPLAGLRSALNATRADWLFVVGWLGTRCHENRVGDAAHKRRRASPKNEAVSVSERCATAASPRVN